MFVSWRKPSFWGRHREGQRVMVGGWDRAGPAELLLPRAHRLAGRRISRALAGILASTRHLLSLALLEFVWIGSCTTSALLLGMGKGLLEGSLLTFGPCGVPKSGHLVPPGPAPGAAASPRSLVLETVWAPVCVHGESRAPVNPQPVTHLPCGPSSLGRPSAAGPGVLPSSAEG